MFKYLELGIYPLRFELMKRSVLFLRYILQQETESMIFQVFKAMQDNPMNNDFLTTCTKYLDKLEIKLSLQEIGKMSKYSFKKLVKCKTEAMAFSYYNQ